MKKHKKHYRASIQLRLFFQVTLIICVCAAGIILFNTYFLEDYYVRSLKDSLVDITKQINTLTDYTSDTSQEKLYEIESQKGVRMRITYNNKVIYKTEEKFDFFKNDHPNGANPFSSCLPSNSPKIIYEFGTIVEHAEISKHGGYFETRTNQAQKQSYLVYTRYLDNGFKIEVFHTKSSIEDNVKLTNDFIFVLMLVMMVFGMLWAYIASRRFTKPLIEMSDITEKMAEMDFSQRCKTTPRDEIGRLGKNINILSSSLDATLRDLKEKNEQLQLDIEYGKKIEQNRKEFISNVSHEFKTPIAIIQGYAEGLKIGLSDDPKRQQEYCDIIIDETRKMNNLVLELLELSKYESLSQAANEQVMFDISQLIKNCVAAFQFKLDKKEIHCSIDVPDECMGYGNAFRIERVLQNYLSNAISHINGKRIVRVSCIDLGEVYRMQVFNTGSPIPEEDLQNIWVSFYRGDKSRNRDQNRFGLGLSIVKAIADLHHTECGVENLEDGVSFWFDVDKTKRAE